jgi:ABC-2 type transport system ATP-binding protein
MHEPELLILDEPSSGLDPLMQQEFHRMVAEVKAEGRTVFLSSHILPEVERVADRVGIVREARLVAVERVEDLKAKARRRIELVFSAPVPLEEFATIPDVERADVFDDGRGIAVTVTGPVDPVIKAAARHELVDVISHQGDLESAFLAYYA